MKPVTYNCWVDKEFIAVEISGDSSVQLLISEIRTIMASKPHLAELLTPLGSKELYAYKIDYIPLPGVASPPEPHTRSRRPRLLDLQSSLGSHFYEPLRRDRLHVLIEVHTIIRTGKTLDDLPPEIIAKILVIAANEEEDYRCTIFCGINYRPDSDRCSFDMLPYLLVSKFFKEIAESTPSLWTRFALVDMPSPMGPPAENQLLYSESCEYIMALWLGRAKSAPLDLVFREQTVMDTIYYNTLLQHKASWGKLCCDNIGDRVPGFSAVKEKIPAITSLTLHHNSVPKMQKGIIDILNSFPQLRFLEVNTQAESVLEVLTAVGKDGAPNWCIGLRHLQFTECNVHPSALLLVSELRNAGGSQFVLSAIECRDAETHEELEVEFALYPKLLEHFQ